MAQLEVTTISLREVPDDIGEKYLPYDPTLRQRQKARAFSKGSYISAITLFKEKQMEEVIQVNARVFRSQRKREEPHRTNMAINTTSKSITEGYCTCKAGISGECAHILSVIMTLSDWILEGLHEIPSQPACTSLPQQWDKPRGLKIQAEPVSTMVIAKPGNINRKRKPLSAIFDDNRKIPLQQSDICYLQSLEDCPLAYLVETGPQSIGCALSYHIPLIKSDEVPIHKLNACGDLNYPKRPNFKLPLNIVGNASQWKQVAVDTDQAISIEQDTRDQRTCDKWHQERKRRITASNFGKFMLRKASVNQKFCDSVMKQKSFTSAATSYGVANEKVAKNMYRKKTGNHIHECGLVINPLFPFLGASPDGKVCDSGLSGILEIKCPFSIRNLTISEALNTNIKKKNLFLEKIGDNIVLKRNHAHWYQVQGQLLVTGANFCDFVTYTRQELHIQRIMPDINIMGNILEKLYFIFTTYVCQTIDEE